MFEDYKAQERNFFQKWWMLILALIVAAPFVIAGLIVVTSKNDMSFGDAFLGVIGMAFVILIIVVACAAAIAIYIFPGLIAAGRKHESAGAILILNLLLGWLFIGWVIALVWALTGGNEKEKSDTVDHRESQEDQKRICPECYLTNPPTSKFCNGCGFQFVKE